MLVSLAIWWSVGLMLMLWLLSFESYRNELSARGDSGVGVLILQVFIHLIAALLWPFVIAYIGYWVVVRARELRQQRLDSLRHWSREKK